MSHSTYKAITNTYYDVTDSTFSLLNNKVFNFDRLDLGMYMQLLRANDGTKRITIINLDFLDTYTVGGSYLRII